MKVKEFDTLRKRDFENGATLNEIRDSLKKLEHFEATNDRAKIKEDIKFLNEMHDITQHLMTKQYDFCRLELLNKMIEDWKDELESSAGL